MPSLLVSETSTSAFSVAIPLALSLSRLIASLNSGKEFREAVGSTRCVEYKASDYIRVRKERVRSEHKTFCDLAWWNLKLAKFFMAER
jgi:hypothetical protein|uniref:Uncharacterized protein n=1 Tax=Populus trichocarpa TaxID=3694 RepID=A0A2K2BLN8_POPTR